MSETACYIAIKQCGCVVAVAVDKPAYKKHTAALVAEWIRESMTVERTTVKDAKERLAACPHREAVCGR